MKRRTLALAIPALLAVHGWAAAKPKKPTCAELAASNAPLPPGLAASSGSLFREGARLSETARDLRAAQINDIVTIVVSERATATSIGTTGSQRESDASASVRAMGGAMPASSLWANLAGFGGKSELAGNGQTGRETRLSTTVSARVSQVLSNGDLVVEGCKDVGVNSEHQSVRVRGTVRWNDLTQGNRVASDRVAGLEVSIDGRGVVNDAIRRPNILYRILLGLLPF